MPASPLKPHPFRHPSRASPLSNITLFRHFLRQSPQSPQSHQPLPPTYPVERAPEPDKSPPTTHVLRDMCQYGVTGVTGVTG